MFAPTESKPRRRWKTISLRGLMLLVVLLAIFFARETNLARRQKRAIDAIQRAGGYVGFDDEYEPDGTRRNVPLKQRPAWQRWVLRTLGEDYVRRVYLVQIDRFGLSALQASRPPLSAETYRSLSGLTDVAVLILREVKAMDEDLAAVGHLSQLRKLDLLMNDAVTDAGLAHLGLLPKLTFVRLDGTSVSGDGLRHLRGSPHLKLLDLEDTAVSDKALALLSQWRDLESLQLGGKQISDEGLVYLNGLSKLQYLSLHATRVSDAGLVHLRNLKDLIILDLSETRIGDAGLAYVANLQNLQSLHLERTRISDAGLAHVANLKNLQSLHLDKTRTGDAGMAHVARLTRLAFLYLGDGVTDKSLPILKTMKSLEVLDLGLSPISDEGFQELEKALPETSIDR